MMMIICLHTVTWFQVFLTPIMCKQLYGFNYFTSGKFFTPADTGCFAWSLSDSKSLQLSGTFLSILANLNRAVVWIDSVLPQISSSFVLFSRLLGIVLSAPTIIGITVTFIFHIFFSCLARSKYSSRFRFSFYLLCSLLDQQSSQVDVQFFLFITTRSGHSVS